MLNSQQWLDNCYSKERRKDIIELEITNKNLEGNLDLSDFINLKKLDCHGNKITDLVISDCINLKELNCSDNNLTNLNINNCINLKELNCSFNNLTSLELSNLKKLKRLLCSNNNLTSLEYFFSPNKLISLNIINNNFSPQDLSAFSKFTNLKVLWIGNDNQEKIEKGIYNGFFGSLSPLKDLTQIESLNISNTDVNSGLEYLSDNIKYLYCSSKESSGNKVQKIFDQLSSFYLFEEDKERYNFENEKFDKINHMTKKIILLGRTGQGKSALANVLSNQKNVSAESENSTSSTKVIKAIPFKHKEKEYEIIDSIGIGDTEMTESQVLVQIAEGYKHIKDGFHQVLFVNGERFTPEEIQTYNLLKGFFFNDDVDKYTTIVRTKFPSFEEEEECQEDIRLLREEKNEKIKNMINSCNGIIHIDNPSVNIKGKRGERDNARNQEVREESRKILLSRLEQWKEEDCKPKSPKELKKQINRDTKDGKLDAQDFQEFLAYIEEHTKSSPKCQIL